MKPGAPLKIALVNLASEDDNWVIMMVPLGIQYLSSALKAALGDRIDVFMGDMGLIPHQTPPEPIVTGFLQSFQPDIIGLRGFSNQKNAFGMVARLAKDLNPDCTIVAGGPHAATLSPSLFDDENIDFVVPLEGEITFVELVRDILNGGDGKSVDGVYWQEDGQKTCRAPRPLIDNLDSIHFPDYTGIDINAYQNYLTMTGMRPKGKATSLFTTRGCYFHCTYCHDHFGKTVRKRSLDNVLDEMEWLMTEHGVTEFQIVDDIFNADRKRAIAFFNEVVRRGWKLNFAFPNGLRGDLITEEFVAAAKEAGTYHWALAIESASPRIQKLVKKYNKLDRLERAIALSDQYRVFTSTFVMLGFPTETREEMQVTLDYLTASKAHMALIFHVQPFEGTTIREQVKELTNGQMAERLGYSHVPAEDEWFTEVSPEEICGIIRDHYWRFHFEPERLKRAIDLTRDTHSKPALAEFMNFCLFESRLTLKTLPIEESRPLLAELFSHEGPVPYASWVPPFHPEQHF